MRLQLLGVVLLLLAIASTLAEDKPTSTNATITATATNNTTTSTVSTDKPICDVCKCDTKTNRLDCGSLNITATFSASQWNATAAAIQQHLSFENNLIRNVTAFPALAVRVLSFCDNRIERIEPNAFRELANLEELDLSHNLLTYQALRPDVFDGKYDPKSYEPLKHLKVLRLNNNKLHELDRDTFEHLPALEWLSLAGNPFRVIADGATVAISRIPELRYLDLSYMELSDLPKFLLHPPDKLSTLLLVGNMLEQIPVALSYAKGLDSLSLDDNPIGNFTGDNTFPALTSLRTLHISYMPTLHSIGKGALSALSNLTRLVCTNNPHLAEIHPAALSRPGITNNATEEWPPIVELQLNNNNLRILNPHMLARWDGLKVLDLQTNPWQCDCENQWLLDTIMPMMANRSGFVSQHMLCDEPAELVGQELLVLKQRSTKMRCLDANGARPERDGAILVGILIGVLVGIPLTLGALLLVRRGCFGLLGKPGPASFSRAFYKPAEMRDTDLRVHI